MASTYRSPGFFSVYTLPPNQAVSIEKQRQFNRYLAAYLGFDFSRGVLAESEHPFTTSLHKDDVRITTHYYENNLESAIFSTIHETGHALFEFGNGDEVTQTPAPALKKD